MRKAGKLILRDSYADAKGGVPMERRKHWVQSIADQADLPWEVLPGVPVVELAGEHRVLIERHGGVTQYSREQICVKVRYGQVCICGCGLELKRMTKEQIIISGRIDAVRLLRGNC